MEWLEGLSPLDSLFHPPRKPTHGIRGTGTAQSTGFYWTYSRAPRDARGRRHYYRRIAAATPVYLRGCGALFYRGLRGRVEVEQAAGVVIEDASSGIVAQRGV